MRQAPVHIKMPKMTMEERTFFYEKMINDVNDRRGMVTDSNSYAYDPATGEYTQTHVGTNDNDGLGPPCTPWVKFSVIRL